MQNLAFKLGPVVISAAEYSAEIKVWCIEKKQPVRLEEKQETNVLYFFKINQLNPAMSFALWAL